jgi:holin-like protein
MINSVTARTPSLPFSAATAHRLLLAGRLVGQFLLLVAMFYAGSAVVWGTGVPLPGNLVGMLLLLVMLRVGLVRLEHVEEAAGLLLKHLTLFFIPLAVGLMAWGGLLGTSGIGLGLSLAGSAAVCLVVAGSVGQRLAPRKGA